GNSINFNDSPDEMFGKTMSIPDNVIYRYFELATGVSDLAEIKQQLADPTTNPRNLKVRLAQEIIAQFYDREAGDAALARFEQLFIKKEVPDDIPEVTIATSEPLSLTQLMADHQLAPSKGEAKRLIQGGGVSLDGEKIDDINHAFMPSPEGVVLKVGKRKFLRVKA
ncbi:MAG TPA: S4 domain-containing protein, partial [Candidatus Kapabacteria bacterium]|nr:S4 domain-containing protein [Candidatus Kapabacteria bacterium]